MSDTIDNFEEVVDSNQVDMIALDEAIDSERDREEEENVGVILKEGENYYEYRRIRVYSILYPVYGIYYTLRHPFIVGPSVIIPILKTCGAIALSLPIVNQTFSLNEQYINDLLINSPYSQYRVVIMAAVWVIQRGWLQYYVFDGIARFFSKGILIKAYQNILNNVESISIKRQVSNEKKVIKDMAYNVITVQEGELPKLKHRPVSKVVLNSFGKLLNFFLPKGHGFFSWMYASLISPLLLTFLPPGTGAIAYSLVNAERRGYQLTKPYSKNLIDRREWLRKNGFQLASLGFMANMLELIPLFGPAFCFSNTVGASLWLATYHRDNLIKNKLL